MAVETPNETTDTENQRRGWKTFKAYDHKNNVRVVVSEDDLRADHRNGRRLTLAIPPRFHHDQSEEAHRAVYHPKSDVNRAIHGALKRLEAERSNGFELVPLDHLATAVLYTPNPGVVTVNMLVEHAAYLETHRDRRANTFLEAALIVDLATRIRQPRVDLEGQAEEWNAVEAVERLLPQMDERLLSKGITFSEFRHQQVEQNAKSRLEKILLRIRTPFMVVVEDIVKSLEKNLQVKKAELTVASDEEDQRELTADVIGIIANTRYCREFLTLGATYDNFEEIATDLTSTVQTRIFHGIEEQDPSSTDPIDSDINEQARLISLETGIDVNTRIDMAETKLDALSSLKGQFREAKRVRDNAVKLIEGDPNDPNSGRRIAASSIRRKDLSNSNLEGIPMINILAAERLASFLKSRMEETNLQAQTQEDLLNLYREYMWEEVLVGDLSREEREKDPFLRNNVDLACSDLEDLIQRLRELNPELDINEIGFVNFIAKTYITSLEDSPLNQAKGQTMELFVPALERKLGIDIRLVYDSLIDDITSEITDEDLLRVYLADEAEVITREVAKNLNHILNYLDIPIDQRDTFISQHGEQLISTLLAYHELVTMANDENLNDRAVLENIADAVFNGSPIRLQLIRCLRWCYPNREVEVVPNGGDWDTFSFDGKPIRRHEWVEIEKLRIYDRVVVKPLVQHGIPIDRITLLATGDYELTGPGYNMPEDHLQAISARNYVEDVRRRVREGSWNVFAGIPVEVVSFKELIESIGVETFRSFLTQVANSYDAVFQDPSLNFLGYTAKSLERTIDVEHDNRRRFISWWTRQNSRDFTRYITTYGLAFGGVVNTQARPLILTVSGNQYSGRNFAKGHIINPETKPVGVTFINSVNDGDVSEQFAKKTTVVQ